MKGFGDFSQEYDSFMCSFDVSEYFQSDNSPRKLRRPRGAPKEPNYVAQPTFPSWNESFGGAIRKNKFQPQFSSTTIEYNSKFSSPPSPSSSTSGMDLNNNLDFTKLPIIDKPLSFIVRKEEVQTFQKENETRPINLFRKKYNPNYPKPDLNANLQKTSVNERLYKIKYGVKADPFKPIRNY